MTNCWIVELISNQCPTVFVEQNLESARRQFHMLIDTVLDHGPIGAKVCLKWTDAAENVVIVATVQVKRTLKGLAE